MQDILKEYGPALITVVAIMALIGIIKIVIGDDADSIVAKSFSELIDTFFASAKSAAGIVGGE